MKKSVFIIPVLVGAILLTGMKTDEKETPEKLGWKLAVQAWTFKEYTFAQALQKIKKLGLKYVEAYTGQKIGGGYEGSTNFTADAKAREGMKKLLKESGITLINYGVVRAKNNAEWKKIFDFAKDMGIQTITAEPTPEQLDYVEKLCNEYKINIAIHNHPQPSFYWNPDTVLKYIKGRSHRIGACADVGHWVRSGLDPVECLKKLNGRVISLHFKDMNEKSRQAHDVPWGTGISNVPEMLKVLKDQGFKGVFSVEYEYHWKTSMPEIEESLKNFRKYVSEL